MGKPIVGISTYREPADWGSWRGVRADLLPAGYADAVTAGGGVPVLLPSLAEMADVHAVLARVDALVIAGGADVEPARYGRQPSPHTTGWRPDRDATELALLDAAAQARTPTLGVCRGMQMMAVQASGTLLQHVPDRVGNGAHSPGPGVYGTVTVHPVPGTRLHEILGDSLVVPCHHHQAVDAHPGLTAAAHAEDGLLEAVEDPARPFWLGVQWHPETSTDLRLFAALVAAARS